MEKKMFSPGAVLPGEDVAGVGTVKWKRACPIQMWGKGRKTARVFAALQPRTKTHMKSSASRSDPPSPTGCAGNE